MACAALRGQYCDVIDLDVCAPIEDKINLMKDRFNKELERIFDKFAKYVQYKYFVRSFQC
jgi:hypothetical protein